MSFEAQDRIRTVVRDAVDDPERALSSLLTLLEALEHEDRATRIEAGWALCLLVERRPDAARVIYERCRDRESAAAEYGAAWIFHHYGDDAWLEADADDADERDPRREERVDHRIVTPATGTEPGVGPNVVSTPVGDEVETDESDPADRTPRSNATDDDSTHDPGDEGDAEGAAGSTARTDAAPDARTDRRTERWDDGRGPQPDRDDDIVVDGAFTIDPSRTEVRSVRYLEAVASDSYSRTYLGLGDVGGTARELLARAYVPPAAASETEFAREFSEAMARWESIDDAPGVMTVFDWGTRPDPWVVTDFASETLWSFGRLPPRVAYRTGVALATTIARAHENGIVHGSLAPRTVLFDRSGDEPAARVVDFGVGTALRDADGPLPLRRAYAAPELVDEDYGGLDWMTDIYQLGLLLYSMFTGRTPETAPDEPAPVLADPTDVVDWLPPETDRIVAKATAPHKISRYESAQELARDLQATLEDYWIEP